MSASVSEYSGNIDQDIGFYFCCYFFTPCTIACLVTAVTSVFKALKEEKNRKLLIKSMVVNELNNQSAVKQAAKIKLEKLQEINELIIKVEQEIKELKEFAKQSERKRLELKETFKNVLKQNSEMDLSNEFNMFL